MSKWLVSCNCGWEQEMDPVDFLELECCLDCNGSRDELETQDLDDDEDCDEDCDEDED